MCPKCQQGASLTIYEILICEYAITNHLCLLNSACICYIYTQQCVVFFHLKVAEEYTSLHTWLCI